MKTFTIDGENNITVHGSKKAAKETGLPSFASAEEFAEIIGTNSGRLVEIFNSLPGINTVTKFANRKAGAQRIWNAIQTLGESAPAASAETATEAEAAEAQPEPAAEQPVAPEGPAEPESTPAEPLADAGAQAADVTPEQAVATNGTTPAKKARKTKKAPTTETEIGRASCRERV